MSHRHRWTALTALCAAACLALFLSGLASPLFALGCLGFVLFKHNLLDRFRFGLPEIVFVIAHALLFLCFLVFAIFSELAHDELSVLLGFATLWMILRTFAEPTPYNDFLIVLSSLIIAVGSAAVATGLVPVLITGGYLLTACYVMPAIMARRDADDGVRIRLLDEPGGWAVAGNFALHHLALGGLLVGALVYLAVPRLAPDSASYQDRGEVEEGLLERRQAREGTGGRDEDVTLTGFPATVRIGQIGRIKRSSRRAFDAWLKVRAQPYDPSVGERSMLLLRADAWDRYDTKKRAWTQWPVTRRALDRLGEISSGPAPVDWTVRLHGYDGRKLFLPSRTRRVRAGGTRLYVDLLGRVHTDHGIREYAAESDMPIMDVGKFAGLRPASRPRLLDVQPSLRAKLEPYVVTMGRPQRILEATQRIQRFFAEGGFRYTLQLPPIPAGMDPVVAFLERREGHCELYASAACLLLRIMGIPARLAGGVRCAERIGKGHYRARFENAHAWVEVACRGVGFVAFDFTPPDSRAVPPSVVPGGPDAAGEQDGVRGADAEDGGIDWSNPFAYGQEQQRRLLRKVRNALGGLLLPLGGLALAVLVGVGLVRRERRPRHDPLRVSQPSGASRRSLGFYARWLRDCAAKGHLRRASQTPREFLAGLPEELRTEGRAVTAEFEAIRYGNGG